MGSRSFSSIHLTLILIIDRISSKKVSAKNLLQVCFNKIYLVGIWCFQVQKLDQGRSSHEASYKYLFIFLEGSCFSEKNDLILIIIHITNSLSIFLTKIWPKLSFSSHLIWSWNENWYFVVNFFPVFCDVFRVVWNLTKNHHSNSSNYTFKTWLPKWLNCPKNPWKL